MSLLKQFNEAAAELAEQVSRSIVQVRDGRHGGAAGTIWHSDGLVMTNSHVIGRGRLTVVLPDGRTAAARVLARDPQRDLAALAVDTNGLAPITLGNSSAVRPGEYVMAIGHPWGVRDAIAAGIVMGADRDYLEVGYPGDLIGVNLTLRPGNSGGPLVDSLGRMIGINTLMTGPDSGLAVPVDAAKAFLRNELGML